MYTTDWHSQHIHNWEIALESLKGRPISFLEIGCFEGRATKWLFDNLNVDFATVIDTFEGSDEHIDMRVDTTHLIDNFKENLIDYLPQIDINVGYSQKILPIINNLYDFIYIDGSHYSKDVFVDAYFAWKLLRKDGIMIFDDYRWKHFEDDRKNPGQGIDLFLKLFEGEYEMLLKDYQVIIKRI